MIEIYYRPTPALVQKLTGNPSSGCMEIFYRPSPALREKLLTASGNKPAKTVREEYRYIRNGQDVRIPQTIGGDSVTAIGNYAFHGCRKLKTITLPTSIRAIGNGAFYHCGRLTGLTLPNALQSLGDSAFSGCEALTEMTLPKSLNRIGARTFADCSRLSAVVIPASVSEIADNAFSGCPSVTLQSPGSGLFGKNHVKEYARLHGFRFEKR